MKREITEWLIFIGVILALYLSGLHTPILGALQNLVLKTGIIQPNYDYNKDVDASYAFTLTDQNGKSVPFDKFKDKVVFMNIWATWCPPCIAEMPDINKLYNNIKTNKDIVFVMISTDDQFENAIKFANKKSFNFPIYQLESRLPDVYHTRSIPTTFVLSPQGRIVMKKSGMAEYNTEKFKRFLTGLSNK